MKQQHSRRICREIVDEIVMRVRTPTPPRPDFSRYENREIEFEKVNKKRLLYYSDTSYKLFQNLESQIREALKDIENQIQSLGLELSAQPGTKTSAKKGDSQTTLSSSISLGEKEDWNFDVDTLRSWIERIPSKDSSVDPTEIEISTKKRNLMRRWSEYVYLCRKRPLNKSPNYFNFQVSLEPF